MKLKRKLLLLSLTILSAFCLLFGIVVLPKPVSHVAQAATLDMPKADEHEVGNSEFEYPYSFDGSHYTYYSATEIVEYTAEQAAALGIPEGYEGNVLAVNHTEASRGVVFDFSGKKIPSDKVKGITFRVYVNAQNDSTGYPAVRIYNKDGVGLLSEDVSARLGSWITITFPMQHIDYISVDGYLSSLELSVRSKTTQVDTVKFYVDSVDVEVEGGNEPETPGLPNYTDSELSVYDVISTNTLFEEESVSIVNGNASNIVYAVSEQNTTYSVVYKFTMMHADMEGAEKIAVLRSYGGAYGFRFYFDTLRIGVLDNWAMTTIAEPIDLIEAGQTYDVEFGAINLKNSNKVWLFIKIDGELVQSVVTTQEDTTYNNRMVSISTSSATGFTLGMPQSAGGGESGLPTYTDAQLVSYDTISVYDLTGAETHTVPAANGSYASATLAYAASVENTTGSTVFKFKLGLNSTSSVERLISLRKNGTYSYRFYFGLDGVNAMVGVFDNNVLRDTSDKVEFHTGAPAEYDVEIGAVDLLDGSGIWQYIKIDGNLIISVVNAAAADANTTSIGVGGNDTAAWTLSQVGEIPVSPIVPVDPSNSEFDFSYFVENENKVYSSYGATDAVEITAQNAAEIGVLAGYNGNILIVNNTIANRGVVLDFSGMAIPAGLISAISFRVYVGTRNETGAYPNLRIANPNKMSEWVLNENISAQTEQWIMVTLSDAAAIAKLCKDGVLDKFELSLRSNSTTPISVKFYIDEVSIDMLENDGVAPVITYTGEETFVSYQGSQFVLPATAYDAQENKEIALTLDWGNAIIGANGAPTEVGVYTLTLTAIDYYGNVATKTITVEIKEPDTEIPVINLNFIAIKAKVGAVVMIEPTATDNSGFATVNSVWSDGAKDILGGLTLGTHTWTITATDPSGNVATKVITIYVTEDAPSFEFITNEEDLIARYTVTFDGANEVIVRDGGKIEKPVDPVKAEDEKARYTFIGWYNGDVEWDFDNDVITEDTNLVSRYAESLKSYLVTFEGGASFKATYGDKVAQENIPAQPIRPSTAEYEFVFEGWAVGDTLWNFETDVITGVTVFAPKFTEVKRQYKVTFDGANETTYEYGAKVVKPADPTKESTETHTYEFLGWEANGKLWNFDTDTVTGNLNLKAKWEETPIDGVEDNSSTDSESSGSSSDGEKTGCFGSVSFSGVAFVALLGACFALKKRKED